MAEETSNVYDILHPTPLSLQELSVIAVGLKLWRSEINEYRKSRTTESFIDSLYSNITPIISKLPKLPPLIYEMIVECVTKLGRSIRSWLLVYSSPVFYYFIKRDRSCVLEYFDDFVIDYDGTIDPVKTAERMMHCDSFDDCLKFTIACTYFLEDHVRRIWPSVRQKMDLRRIHFDRNPMMNYWIRLLRNQLNKIPIDPCDTVAENMLLVCIYMPGNSLAINYFWNGVPYEDEMRIAILVFQRNTECFVKSILPKLDDQQVEKFINEKGQSEYLMRALLEEHSHDERFIFQTLMYVKNAMNGSTFSNLVVIILRIEAGFFSRIVHDLDHQKIENWLHVGCIIWDSAPHHLKRSAITDISSDLELMICREDDKPPSITRTTSTSSEFLLSILSDFTLEESRSFWRNCWKNLMINKSARDLQRIMEICLKHEDDIIKFKENVIAESESLQRRCGWLLLCGNYDELDALVNFSYPHSAESAKHLKRRLLQSNFIGENSGF
ncbi:uncharacterized protein LOC135847730 isoform X9 [Planococcus citri]|uniref:uncharacterized protein LOC135847730 isoform X9 n=1 Tax=Planococcus citri TaxID=170843 RepID=UPI0031F830DC